MRRILVVLVSTVALILGGSAASAAPVGSPDRTHAPSIADADGDGLADDLEAQLAATDPGDRVDVIVQFARPSSAAAAQRAVGAFTVRRELSIIDGFSATMTAAQARALAKRDEVFRVEGNARVEAFLDAASSDYGAASARSTYGVDGSGAGVCVIDTGADPNHVELDGGKIVGWKDYVNGRSTPYDDHGHGTHVTATAVGDGSGSTNAAKYVGVAPGASAYVAKVLNASGAGSMDDVADAIGWCAGFSGVRVISLSLGTTGSSDGKDAASSAADAAVGAGKVVVVAAGNSGDEPNTIGSPGASEGAITVGAVGGTSSGGFHLAFWSSRGPTADGRVKPDIAAPGVAITAAQAGTTDGYATMSGTSMATPHIAGLVALALDHDPTRTPADIKTLIGSTARDAGATGKDNEFGWGLVDGHAFVAAAGGTTDSSFPMPAHTGLEGTAPNNGQWTHSFSLGPDDLDVPIGATMVIDGSLKCAFRYWGMCWSWEWSPDLDLELIGPGGGVLASSTCALGDECYRGRTETIHAAPTSAGTYTWRVWGAQDDVNNGQGGTFRLDWWSGPRVGAGSPPPPPEEENQPPVADAGIDRTIADSDGVAGESVVLDGSASDDPDGSIASYVWSEGGSQIATGVGPTVTLADGAHTITLTVTDDEGATDTDEVVITVEAPSSSPPPPETLHVGDLDGATSEDKNTWSATVTITVHDASEGSVSNAVVSGTWGSGTVSCTTDASGTCTVTLGGMHKKDKTATFAVTSIGHGSLTYDGSANHDPDGDSDGSSITIAR